MPWGLRHSPAHIRGTPTLRRCETGRSIGLNGSEAPARTSVRQARRAFPASSRPPANPRASRASPSDSETRCALPRAHRIAIVAIAREQSALLERREIRHVRGDQQFERIALLRDLIDHREHARQRRRRIACDRPPADDAAPSSAPAKRVRSFWPNGRTLPSSSVHASRTARLRGEMRIRVALRGVQQHRGNARIAQPFEHRTRERRAGMRQQCKLLEHRRADRRMHVDMPARAGRPTSCRAKNCVAARFQCCRTRRFMTVRHLRMPAAEEAVQIIVEIAARGAHRVDVAKNHQQAARQRQPALLRCRAPAATAIRSARSRRHARLRRRARCARRPRCRSGLQLQRRRRPATSSARRWRRRPAPHSLPDACPPACTRENRSSSALMPCSALEVIQRAQAENLRQFVKRRARFEQADSDRSGQPARDDRDSAFRSTHRGGRTARR